MIDAAVCFKHLGSCAAEDVGASKATAELDRLKVLMTQKDQELTALVAIEKALMEVVGQKKGADAKQLILETMMSFEQLKKLVVDPADESGVQPTDVVKRVAALKAQDDMLAAAFGANSDQTKDQLQDAIKHAAALEQLEKTVRVQLNYRRPIKTYEARFSSCRIA